MDEIIKHDEGQVPVKVKLASLPSVAQANVNLFDFEDNLQQCMYDMRDLPLSHITFSSTLMALWAGNDIDTSCATATLSLSSMMLRNLNSAHSLSLCLTCSMS